MNHGYDELPKTPARELLLVCPACHREVPARGFERFITASRETWEKQNVLIEHSCDIDCEQPGCGSTVTVKFVKDSGDSKPYFRISAVPKPWPLWKTTTKHIAMHLLTVAFIGIAASSVYQVFKWSNQD